MPRRRPVRTSARRRLALGVPLLIILGSLVPAGQAATAPPGPTVPDDTWVTDGAVWAVARAGDSVYLGGRFDRVGPRTGPGVEVDLDGRRRPGGPEVSGAGPSALLGSGGSVTAVAADGSGGWYVGGLFRRIGGLPRTNLAHILADRTVDPAFAPVLDDAVHALAVSGSGPGATVYVAGLFTTVDGLARGRVAGLRAADGTPTAFDPGANAGVEALALAADGRTVYAGGRFTTIGGLPRLALAALDPATGAASPTFNPVGTTGTLGSGVVSALAVSRSTLYVGGSFSSLGGLPRDNLGAVSLGLPLDGVGVAAFDPKPSQGTCAACAAVSALAVSGSGPAAIVYAGGRFTTVGGQPRRYLAGLRTADGTATAFDPSPNGTVFALAATADTVYAVGSFTSGDGTASIGGQPRDRAAALRATDGAATGFDPRANGVVAAVAVGAGSVYLGGHFSSLGGVVRHNVAALSAQTGEATSFDPDVRGPGTSNATVYALAVDGETVYLGGYLGSVGGRPRGGLAAVRTDGTPTGWDPGAAYSGGPSVIDDLAVGPDVVYAAGVFTTAGGATRGNLAALRRSDGRATGWAPAPNSEVTALALSGDLLYVGGFFTSIGGQPRHSIAALRTTDATATAWDPDTGEHSNVQALAVSGSGPAATVYAGGNFATVHGVTRTNVAGISAADGVPTAFDPRATDAATGGGVMGLAVSDGTVYAAGFFSGIGGAARSLLAGLDASTGRATAFDPRGAPGFGAYAVAVADDGTLYAGGSFDTLDRAYQQGFAQFTAPDGAIG